MPYTQAPTALSARDPQIDMSPRNGDVVITKLTQPDGGYEIRIEPGPPQFRCDKKEAAMAHAQRFARHVAVNVWYREGGAVTLVEARRSKR